MKSNLNNIEETVALQNAGTATRLPDIPKENAFHFLRTVCCLIVLYEHCAVLSGAEK